MLIAGLTGGIASGKNSVAAILEALGARTIDADLISRELVEKGRPAWREIVDAFGEEVLRSDGTIDRKLLGGIIFADEEKRKILNSIMHPRIINEEKRLIACIEEEYPDSIVVVNAALLIESGNYRSVDKVIVVSADEETAIKRAVARDKISPEEASLRIRAQAPIGEKLKYADFVVENSGTLDELREKVIRLYEKLRDLGR